jgi:hypothetical protein
MAISQNTSRRTKTQRSASSHTSLKSRLPQDLHPRPNRSRLPGGEFGITPALRKTLSVSFRNTSSEASRSKISASRLEPPAPSAYSLPCPSTLSPELMKAASRKRPPSLFEELKAPGSDDFSNEVIEGVADNAEDAFQKVLASHRGPPNLRPLCRQ